MNEEAKAVLRRYFVSTNAAGREDDELDPYVKQLLGELFSIANKLSRHTMVDVVIHYMGSCNTINIMYGMANMNDLNDVKYTNTNTYPLNHPDVREALEELCKRLVKMYIQLTSKGAM